MLSRVLLIIVFGVVGLGLAGCSTAPTQGAWVREEARPPKLRADLRELIPWTADGGQPTDYEIEAEPGVFVTTYEVVEGPDAGALMRSTRRPGPEAGTWLMTRKLDSEDEPREERLQLIDPSSGGLILRSMKNFERNVNVQFSPGALTVPASLAPDQSVVSEMSLRLPYLDRPGKLREKGTGRAEITYAADQRVRIGERSVDTRLLREIFTTTLTSAVATRTIERCFAPGKGLVAERWEEEVRVFGVVVERSVQAIRVLPPGEEAGSAAAITPDAASGPESEGGE